MKGVLTRAWHLRAWHGKRYVLRHPFDAARFLFLSRERTNFTYDVSNLDGLVAFVARHTRVTESTARGFVDEILHDSEFHGWLSQARRQSNGRRGKTRIGRRAGWYALARILKPKVIIETGTHDGLGSSVFARAVQRNAAEGTPGTLWTFDINPDAGWLIPGPLRPHVQQTIGDLRTTLPARARELKKGDLGIFLHDSDHSPEFETFEYNTVRSRLASTSLVLSDNAHVTDALQRFAAVSKGTYDFWKETPRRHPYPGCGIGLVRWT